LYFKLNNKKMKKFLISALLIAGSFGFANAQAKQKVAAHKATTSSTLKTVPAPTTTPAPVVKMNDKKVAAKTTTTTTHVKANGTPDKRFKENKTSTTVVGPLKKNGTADMRYKANKKK
jgi:hypothetical protein